jgi:predicted dehydrogenase
MGEFMTALAEGRDPQTSGADNLRSLGVAEAAIQSAEGERVCVTAGGDAGYHVVAECTLLESE